MDNKKYIREKILNIRKNLTENFVEKNSSIIVNKLCKIIDSRNFFDIMIFMDMNNEVRIRKLLNIYPKKNFYIPRTFDKGKMKINKYSKKDLVLHKFGYYESSSAVYIDETVPELIVIPGIAFDSERHRIGFGGGYYDRFLERLKEKHSSVGSKFPLTVAVCYDFQLLSSIPSEKHDINPEIIITEKRVVSPFTVI